MTLGVTDFEPDATGVTEPIPLSILNEDALVVVQERVEELPVKKAPMLLKSEGGFTESVQVGA